MARTKPVIIVVFGYKTHSIPAFSQKSLKAECARQLTLALANFRALLSLEIFNNSIILLSYGAKPTTSLTKSRVNLVRLYKVCQIDNLKLQ